MTPKFVTIDSSNYANWVKEGFIEVSKYKFSFISFNLPSKKVHSCNIVTVILAIKFLVNENSTRLD